MHGERSYNNASCADQALAEYHTASCIKYCLHRQPLCELRFALGVIGSSM